MGWAKPDHGRFLSKVLVTIVPAAMASGIVVYALYAIHLTRAPESADRLTLASPLSDGLSTDERRELTRQMLKARRENPPVPAEVRPTPRPLSTGTADHAAVPPSAADAKLRPVRAVAVAPVAAPAAAPVPVARPSAARTPSQAPAVAVAVAPAALPHATAGEPGTLPPVTVNTNPPAARSDPEPRGFAANVFSSISVFAGTAANATGNTVNWVIDLPGRAISAGGRLLGGDPAAPNPPPSATPAPPLATAPAPPPATAPAPAPKRNIL
jgi:hypothetical protein